MKAIQLREKSSDELGKLLIELTRESFNLKIQKATNQLDKKDQIKKARRNIARIHTVMNEKVSASK
ncbi:MAG: 50S ribosomal protein L29 [Methylovulum sp.]|jgi:large subunit ribosomal protein L29|nr:50S ribosomal protein L29 [Methylovulum sp.]MCF8007136.1 50S ribosomal protein L29 [Methylovulum sp.]